MEPTSKKWKKEALKNENECAQKYLLKFFESFCVASWEISHLSFLKASVLEQVMEEN